jgi:hypothetical protein
MSAHDDYPTLTHWLNGGPLTGSLGERMKVEVASVLDEVDRLRSDLSARSTFAGGWQGGTPSGTGVVDL